MYSNVYYCICTRFIGGVKGHLMFKGPPPFWNLTNSPFPPESWLPPCTWKFSLLEWILLYWPYIYVHTYIRTYVPSQALLQVGEVNSKYIHMYILYVRNFSIGFSMCTYIPWDKLWWSFMIARCDTPHPPVLGTYACVVSAFVWLPLLLPVLNSAVLSSSVHFLTFISCGSLMLAPYSTCTHVCICSRTGWVCNCLIEAIKQCLLSDLRTRYWLPYCL